MTLEEFKTVLDSSGLPVAYESFPEAECPEMPFITFQETMSNNVIADNHVYVRVRHIQIDLFTSGKDVEAEEKLESALSGFAWDCVQTLDEDEACNRLTYEIEI